MTIFHFGKVLKLVRSLKTAPVLRSKIRIDTLRQCGKDFETAFPLYQQIRDAIAHAGEFLQAEQLKRHAIKGEIIIDGLYEGYVGQGNFISNLSGRKFGTTFEGAYITYSVSEETHSELVAIKDRVYEAYAPITI